MLNSRDLFPRVLFFSANLLQLHQQPSEKRQRNGAAMDIYGGGRHVGIKSMKKDYFEIFHEASIFWRVLRVNPNMGQGQASWHGPAHATFLSRRALLCFGFFTIGILLGLALASRAPSLCHIMA